MNVIKSFFGKFREIEDKNFLQAKWNYYAKFTTMVVFFGSLSSILFFVSDCQLFGRIAWETMLPRFFILIPLLLYLILVQKVKDYKILSLASLGMCHMIMWCTIGAIIFLPDKTHASEGFVIMNLLFFGISFGTPFVMSSIGHTLMLFNIFVTDLFIHYQNIEIMYSLNIPCILGIVAASYAMDSVYMDNYKMTNQIETAMVTDALTGCYNRHKLSKLITDNNLNALGEPLCIVLLDIDFFKKVNDKYGHDSGDIVLQYVANCIKQALRNADIVIRWGGEEFLMLLKNCTTEDAVKIAERVRLMIEQNENSICKVTASMGITIYEKDCNYLDAISQADNALYKAKNSGRNRVVLYIEE